MLVLGDGGPLTLAGLALMLVFHTYILNMPMGAPLEWNVVVVYGGLFLWGAHGGVSPLDATGGLAVAFLLAWTVLIPLVGHLSPRHVSFLLAMRYYAGNWPYTVWALTPAAVDKLRARLPRSAPLVHDQVGRLFGEGVAVGTVGMVLGFRSMHLHGRVLHPLLRRFVPDLEDRVILDGELMAGMALGWNFGDGHLSGPDLLAAIQRVCGFELGEVRMVAVESQPLHRWHQDWEAWDARGGRLGGGRVHVRDYRDAMPWPEPRRRARGRRRRRDAMSACAARPGLPNLHCHLDGSLRPDTLAELARAAGVAVPRDLAFAPGMGLQEALARFAFTLSLLQTPAAVTRVADEMCLDAAIDGVHTLEVRFAPQLHGGGTLEEIVDAALAASPAGPGSSSARSTARTPPWRRRWSRWPRPGRGGGPRPRGRTGARPPLRDARLRRRLSAGRGPRHRPDRPRRRGRPPAEIRVAIEVLHAQRIGHGTPLLDDPSGGELVRERGVTIEACPTSNWHTGAIPTATAHPMARWLDAGIRVCVNPDNTLLSAVSASEEHARAATLDGMRPALLARAIGFGHAAAFTRSPAGTPSG